MAVQSLATINGVTFWVDTDISTEIQGYLNDLSTNQLWLNSLTNAATRPAANVSNIVVTIDPLDLPEQAGAYSVRQALVNDVYGATSGKELGGSTKDLAGAGIAYVLLNNDPTGGTSINPIAPGLRTRSTSFAHEVLHVGRPLDEQFVYPPTEHPQKWTDDTQAVFNLEGKVFDPNRALSPGTLLYSAQNPSQIAGPQNGGVPQPQGTASRAITGKDDASQDYFDATGNLVHQDIRLATGGFNVVDNDFAGLQPWTSRSIVADTLGVIASTSFTVSAGDTGTITGTAGITDTIEASVTTTLGADMDNLTLTGIASLNGTGNALANVISGTAGNNTLTGLDGDDRLIGGAGNDNLQGGNGTDVLNGGAGDDTLNGGAGNDTAVYSGTGTTAGVIVNLSLTTAQNTGGAGIDTLAAIENVIGTDFRDVFTGTSANNVFDGGAEFDTVSYANATGAVTVDLTITTGQNTVNAGNDTLKSIEFLEGSGFGDTLNGNADINYIEGGAGNDVMNGGGSIDYLAYTKAASAVTVSLAITTAQNTGGAGTDTISNFENLYGSQFNDTLTGNALDNLVHGGAGNDTINGGAGADTLIGSSGNDTMNGGDGADRISGDSGNDILSGGAGNDVFVFNSALNATTNSDTISDFVAGSDKFELENTGTGLFTAITATGALAAGAFWSAAGAASGHDGDDRIVYNTTTGALYYDADGNGGAAAVRFATLSTKPAITSADFLVV